MELGQAKAFGVLDDHERGVGDVYADFDDRGSDEHIDIAALEAAHDDFLVVGAKASMEQPEAKSRKVGGAEGLVHVSGGLEGRLLEERFLFCFV